MQHICVKHFPLESDTHEEVSYLKDSFDERIWGRICGQKVILLTNIEFRFGPSFDGWQLALN